MDFTRQAFLLQETGSQEQYPSVRQMPSVTVHGLPGVCKGRNCVVTSCRDRRSLTLVRRNTAELSQRVDLKTSCGET